jgi:hypothetical protein
MFVASEISLTVQLTFLSGFFLSVCLKAFERIKSFFASKQRQVHSRVLHSPNLPRNTRVKVVAVQSPSDPESAFRIRNRLYTRENITIYHAISPFGCCVFSFRWKRIHTERQAGFRTPTTAITFNSCWLQNLFLDFDVCQNWKVSIYTFEFGRGVRESSLGMRGSGLRFFKQPLWLFFFTSLWLKEEGVLWKLWSSGACKLPRLVGFQKQKCVYVSSRALGIITLKISEK